jgi:xanthine dehydrogenase YagT iron-sulfur-binding subunit
MNEEKPGTRQGAGCDRRLFIAGGATVATIPLLPIAKSSAASAAPAGQEKDEAVVLRINGEDYRLSLDRRTTLLDALRDHIGLTGTKKGCDHGQCGACTVLAGGRRVLSCMTLAIMAEGQPITTVEGLANRNGDLHPMQQAFIDNDAFQCGYCTPGQILSAIACVHENHAGSDDEIREYMSGNICRCAAYPNIVDAVKQAKTQMEKA